MSAATELRIEVGEIRRDVGDLKVSVATIVTRLDAMQSGNGNGNGGIFKSKALNAVVDKTITTVLMGGAALLAVKFGIPITGGTP